MLSRGPVWHVAIALSLLSGCYDMHGAARPGDVPRDASSPALDAMAPAPDASLPIPDAGPRTDDAGDRCASVLAALRAGVPAESIGCDGRTFPRDCAAEVGLCCTVFLGCAIDPGDGGHVTADLTCTDDCDQSCGAQRLDDCAFYPWCERFDPGACGPAPDGIVEGPACIRRRGDPCSSDGDCSAGAECASYWINPCAGLPCAACGGEERRCSF